MQAKSCIKVNSGNSEFFQSSVGVRQWGKGVRGGGGGGLLQNLECIC